MIKVGDFGIACVVVGSDLIVTGVVIGTVLYFVFEQVEGKVVDYCVDLYVLGCVVYCCFLGMILWMLDNEFGVVMVWIFWFFDLFGPKCLEVFK